MLLINGHARNRTADTDSYYATKQRSTPTGAFIVSGRQQGQHEWLFPSW
jgi:hypothetical protein